MGQSSGPCWERFQGFSTCWLPSATLRPCFLRVPERQCELRQFHRRHCACDTTNDITTRLAAHAKVLFLVRDVCAFRRARRVAGPVFADHIDNGERQNAIPSICAGNACSGQAHLPHSHRGCTDRQSLDRCGEGRFQSAQRQLGA